MPKTAIINQNDRAAPRKAPTTQRATARKFFGSGSILPIRWSKWRCRAILKVSHDI